MSTLFVIFPIVAPVILLAAVGFTWVRLGYDYSVVFVTRLAMTLSVPCLVFVALMKAEISPTVLAEIFWVTLLIYLVLTGLFFGLLRLKGLDGSTYMHPLVFGNTGNIGLPVAYFAFGAEGLSIAVVILAVMMGYGFTIGIWMVAGKGSLARVFKEPVAYGSIFGAIFLVFGWQTPLWLTNTLELAGQMAIPMMLITLGVALGRITPASFIRPVVLSGIKLVICASVAIVIGLYFDLDPIVFSVLLLQITTPVAVTSYLLVEKYGGDSETVAGLVVISTALSVITIPVTLAFLV